LRDASRRWGSRRPKGIEQRKTDTSPALDAGVADDHTPNLVPRPPSPAKFCQKCKVREPRADFMVAADNAEDPKVSLFCETCRTTLQTCRVCGIAKPICEFNRQSNRWGRCKACRRNPLALKATLKHVQRSGLPEAGRDRVSQALRIAYEKDPDEASKRANRRREERLRAAPRERIYRQRIFERDGWICWICGEAVEPQDATLDHVVPVSLGGAHTPANVRLAHGVCNSRRAEPVKLGETLRVRD
jgi:5-methylcytosine-specific restriction endonuclease McrA